VSVLVVRADTFAVAQKLDRIVPSVLLKHRARSSAG
jgi:hypothetical protein